MFTRVIVLAFLADTATWVEHFLLIEAYESNVVMDSINNGLRPRILHENESCTGYQQDPFLLLSPSPMHFVTVDSG
jgi:hypothetical protein